MEAFNDGFQKELESLFSPAELETFLGHIGRVADVDPARVRRLRQRPAQGTRLRPGLVAGPRRLGLVLLFSIKRRRIHGLLRTP
nr:hypothetical protein [Paludisphaera mucosa]